MGAGVGALLDNAGFAPSVRRGGLDPNPALRDQVARWRRMGASWQAIGRMLGGHAETDVRALFDPDWGRAPEPAAQPAPSVVQSRRACLSPEARQVLAALSGRPRSSGVLAQALRMTRPAVTAALKTLRGSDLADRYSTGLWELTRTGRQQAAALAREAAATLPADSLKVLAALATRANGPRTASQIVGISERATAQAIAALRDLGFVERRTNGTYAVTWAGRDALAVAGGDRAIETGGEA